MNKLAISLIALAALSTASFAEGSRDEDLREAGILKSGYGTQVNSTPTADYAFATVGQNNGGSAYELARQNAEASVLSTDNH